MPANTRDKVLSSGTRRTPVNVSRAAPRRSHTTFGTSAAHSTISKTRLEPETTAAIAVASSPGNG